jgi:hypothetical protein
MLMFGVPFCATNRSVTFTIPALLTKSSETAMWSSAFIPVLVITEPTIVDAPIPFIAWTCIPICEFNIWRFSDYVAVLSTKGKIYAVIFATYESCSAKLALDPEEKVPPKDSAPKTANAESELNVLNSNHPVAGPPIMFMFL